MDDDLNVSGAMASIFAELKVADSLLETGEFAKLAVVVAQIRNALGILGIDPLAKEWEEAFVEQVVELPPEEVAKIEELIDQRKAAKLAKNYALADKIRDDLQKSGIELIDTAEGVQWKSVGK
jgi:cysteinyl-tRNA synthetase